jgi:hypothetical protein
LTGIAGELTRLSCEVTYKNLRHPKPPPLPSPTTHKEPSFLIIFAITHLPIVIVIWSPFLSSFLPFHSHITTSIPTCSAYLSVPSQPPTALSPAPSLLLLPEWVKAIPVLLALAVFRAGMSLPLFLILRHLGLRWRCRRHLNG